MFRYNPTAQECSLTIEQTLDGMRAELKINNWMFSNNHEGGLLVSCSVQPTAENINGFLGGYIGGVHVADSRSVSMIIMSGKHNRHHYGMLQTSSMQPPLQYL